MNRKYTADVHEEAIQRLCFVCGDLINGQMYEVDNNIPLLGRALKCPELFSIPGVTPQNFCLKCYAYMIHLDRGETLKSSISLIEWTECGENCSSCGIILKRRAGGRKKKVSVSDSTHQTPKIS